MFKQIATLVTAAALSFGTSVVMAQAAAPATAPAAKPAAAATPATPATPAAPAAAAKPAAPAAAAGGNCEKQADEKKLAGAARNSFVKKCSGGAAGGSDATKACEAKAVSKEGKPLAGAAKNSFMKKCVADTK